MGDIVLLEAECFLTEIKKLYPFEEKTLDESKNY